MFVDKVCREIGGTPGPAFWHRWDVSGFIFCLPHCLKWRSQSFFVMLHHRVFFLTNLQST